MLAVVGVDDATLAAVEALAVVTGKLRLHGGRMGFVHLARFRFVAVLDQPGNFERFDVHLIERLFHRREIDFARGVGEVPRIAREPARHQH